jgi:hypothetical protein
MKLTVVEAAEAAEAILIIITLEDSDLEWTREEEM